jgi:membrane-bound lytic murein transglycosylase D
MAIKHIIAAPSNFGLALTDIPNKPYFAEVKTSHHMDVELAAEMAGITTEEFIALNPAHNRPVILQKDDDVLLLPVESVDVFRANLERASQPLVSWQAYAAKKGENLDELASRFGISSEKLKTINGLSRHINVSNGQALLVPLNGEQAETEFAAFNTQLAATDQNLLNAVRHTVRRGDTLSGIAKRYHVRLSSLKSWNKGVKVLRPGQHILVAQRDRASPTVQRTTRIRAIKASTKRIKTTPITLKY